MTEHAAARDRAIPDRKEATGELQRSAEAAPPRIAWTPGPWKRGGLFGTVVYVGSDNLDDPAAHTEICDTFHWDHRTDAEAAANARLISASPTMADELETVLSLLGSVSLLSHPIARDAAIAAGRINVLLRAARGEPE